MSGKANDPIALQVRMTEDLRHKLATAAEANGRSLNAEILWRLNQSFGLKSPLYEQIRGTVEELLAERGYAAREPLKKKQLKS
jgi:Arc-like DNA binding domain